MLLMVEPNDFQILIVHGLLLACLIGSLARASFDSTNDAPIAIEGKSRLASLRFTEGIPKEHAWMASVYNLTVIISD